MNQRKKKTMKTQISKNQKEIIILKIELEKEKVLKDIDNLLINALETYSGYWAAIAKVGTEKSIKDLYYVGKDITVREKEASDSYSIVKSKKLTIDKLLEGFTIMANKYPRHFSDVLTENDDAETADVFLQCCVLGSVIYG